MFLLQLSTFLMENIYLTLLLSILTYEVNLFQSYCIRIRRRGGAQGPFLLYEVGATKICFQFDQEFYSIYGACHQVAMLSQHPVSIPWIHGGGGLCTRFLGVSHTIQLIRLTRASGLIFQSVCACYLVEFCKFWLYIEPYVEWSWKYLRKIGGGNG